MTGHTSLELALARVRLVRPPYTVADTQAAEARLAARITARMLHGALSFDDQMAPARTAAARTAERSDLPHRAFRRQLQALCRTVVTRNLHELGGFLTCRILEPAGALVLGCVLHLAERGDSAQFWWQFAAGAGNRGAACCLYLHHMALGERREAELWHEQAGLEHLIPKTPETIDRTDLNAVLSLLAHLRGTSVFSAATNAVIAYVPHALDDNDALDLPLPDPDFAERIEELTSIAS
ncbi:MULTISPECIES: hypothetical protein [Streptomyces]|uniref:Uncharacterized protein n=1 Tax=Streptomyces aureoversilis TaxID=67277 RepID=A0ABW0A832_9ACTN|nr:hypothetical protein [Streptomyces rectiverticillatus]QLE75095.1 hypothetical protein FGW37_28935 [Streptomyces rectiverticillatus]